MSNCTNTNPLQRSGTSQPDRVLQALLPASAPVDERDYADLVLFARKYASFLTYYDSRLHAVGDWTPFMKMDISVTLASIAKENAGDYFTYIKYLYVQTLAEARRSVTAASPADRAAALVLAQQYYTTILNFMMSLVYHLNDQTILLPVDFAFTQWLHITIRSRLLDNYSTLYAYYAGSVTDTLIDQTKPWVGEQPPYPVSRYTDLKTVPLNTQDWATPSVLPPAPIDGTTTADRITHTVNHGIFQGAIENFLKGYSSIIDTASGYLDQTLGEFPTHSPHYALYLSFLKLFRKSQNHLNGFTNLHLKYYYQDVLHLVTNPAVPDRVYLLFALQKNISQHLLSKGTAFKAGKDAQNRDKIYTLLSDLVVNTGVVSSLKSLYCPAPTGGAGYFGPLLASPVANSEDGLGAALTAADKSWWPFGNPALDQAAGYGFAIAHPILFLQEGTRNITVRFVPADANWQDTLGVAPVNANFTASLTGLKKWVTTDVVFGTDDDGSLIFTLTLDATVDAIIPYSEKIHKSGMVLAAALPVLRIHVVDPAGSGTLGAATQNYCAALASVAVTGIDVSVNVTGVKNVTVFNETGPQDPSKSFALFGPQPFVGATAIIGSNEICYKNITASGLTVDINLGWDKLQPVTDYGHAANKQANCYMLTGGVWKAAGKADQPILQVITREIGIDVLADDLFGGGMGLSGFEVEEITVNSIATSNTLSFSLPAYDGLYDFGPNPTYTVGAKDGFLKIEFDGPSDFGHFDYIQRLMAATLKNDPANLPEQPYTPAVKSFTINYKAVAEIDLADAVNPATTGGASVSGGGVTTAGASATGGPIATGSGGSFYHLGPFGTALQSKAILGSSASIRLLPAFPNEGELYIGIDAFQPDWNLSLLFQVSEGSADPNLNEQTIGWYFLGADNQWIAFDKHAVADDTGNLTRTGIITFQFPDTATNNNTLMGAPLFWIRAAVAAETGAICHIISVQAQAAEAQLADYYHTGVVYTDVLAASTISKLLVSDAAVKTISQPSTSFEGQVAEPDAAFYTRISERLRHKNRSITMWDYERMVLQQFPDVFKVKCINHTKIGASSADGDNELAPGYVLVVPIPNLNGRNAIDPLRPQTSLGVLTQIGDYLRGLISPFVRLQVKNARFDEIQLDFKVQFLDGDASFYATQLNTALEEFMSPWAFGGTQEIEFGGKVSKSVLLNFVEGLGYVDYVTCFKMYQIVDGVKSADQEEAVASSSRSIMVSSKDHLIDFLNPDCNC